MMIYPTEYKNILIRLYKQDRCIRQIICKLTRDIDGEAVYIPINDTEIDLSGAAYIGVEGMKQDGEV